MTGWWFIRETMKIGAFLLDAMRDAWDAARWTIVVGVVVVRWMESGLWILELRRKF
jgi:hypothetical protein